MCAGGTLELCVYTVLWWRLHCCLMLRHLPLCIFTVVLLILLSDCTLADTLAEAGRESPRLDEDVLAAIRGVDDVYKNHPGYKHYIWEHFATAGGQQLKVIWRWSGKP